MTTNSLVFDFACSCEVTPTGDLWLCDVCMTTDDLHGELVTEESTYQLGYDEFNPHYPSEAAARAAGVSEEEILAAREAVLNYEHSIDTRLYERRMASYGYPVYEVN